MLPFGARQWLLPSLLLFSICTAAFTYGFSVSQFKVFPYSILRDARTALYALLDVADTGEINGLASYKVQVSEPTAIHHSDRIGNQAILISGGVDRLTSLHPEGCLAWIIDRDGQVLHTWKNHPGLWDDLKTVTRVPGISGGINPVGMHLFANGDLLATFHGYNTFPFAIGIARFDRDSRLLWKHELLTHHCFSVAPDGRIFVPAMEIVESPVQIASTAARIESESGKIYHDLILVLSPDGTILERISVLDALFDSGFHGHLTRSLANSVNSDDPLHLNDVQLIGESASAQLSGIEADDLLISMRNINTVGILDPHTRRFKWMSSGGSVGQHSPRIYQQGVIVLDNLGGDHELGGTQLVEIDFQSGLPRTLFPRADAPAPMPDRCRTANSGHLDIDHQRQCALLTITHAGALWEVDLQTGEVLWEYIHVDSEGQGKRQLIGLSKYVTDLSFLNL